MGLNITPEEGAAQARRDQPRSQEDGQYGPAVRCEELLGRSIGMFIDRSLQLTGQLNDSHVAALLELAKRRQRSPSTWWTTSQIRDLSKGFGS